MKGDFERYLAAKSTVDDRALDRAVLARFREDLRTHVDPRLLEAGAGTAAFCRRLLSWSQPQDCTYVAVDTDPALLSTARELILETARNEGFRASLADPTATEFGPPADVDGGTTVAAIRLSGPARIDVHLVAGDALAVASRGRWDALVAQAFVDLLSPADVARLVSGVVDGGPVYFPITFDGETTFSPPHPTDEVVIDAYHDTMIGTDGGRLGARAGQRLRTRSSDLGIDLAAVGESDWSVAPSDDAYPADEAYFLEVIVDTVADAVRGRVSDETVDAWLAARSHQREAGELGFVARNLDLYGHRVVSE